MEKKLKAYADRLEQRYEDFSVMDTISGYKKEVVEALNDLDRSRSNSPKGDRQKGARQKQNALEESSEDEAAKQPKFRKSYSHTVEAGKSKD